MSMCTYTGMLPKLDCVLHKCHKGGADYLQGLIMEGNSILLRDTSKYVLIKQWVDNQWHRNDQMQPYLDWNHVNVLYLGLVEMLFTLMENIAKNAFFASWNFTQFLNCKRNLQQRSYICSCFCTELFVCPSGWTTGPTLGTSTCNNSSISGYYQCKEHKCSKLIMHEIVHVSVDVKNDTHLVKSFVKQIWKSWMILILNVKKYWGLQIKHLVNTKISLLLDTFLKVKYLWYIISLECIMEKTLVIHVLVMLNKW